MTTFLLIRHATCASVGPVLCGRTPGIRLDDCGRAEVERLVAGLADRALDLVATSPMERAVETAEPLARGAGLSAVVCEEMTELDYGEWTGKAVKELSGRERWRHFNSSRSCARIPGGEALFEVQARAVGWMERIRLDHPEGSVAVVSHADVLRSVLAYYLAVPLDLAGRIEVVPAAVTTLEVADWGPRLLELNRSF